MLSPRRLVSQILLTLLSLVAVVTGYAIWQIKADVDRATTRLSLNPGPASTVIFDAKDRPISALYKQHRLPVSLEEMSEVLVQAVLMTEDRRFYEHDGVDRRRILASMLANFRAGRVAQGASTITQQFARAAVLDRSRTYGRKLREVWLAHRLEEKYGKRAILQAYLNHVYFGDGYYGVEAASRGYFAKPAAKLNAAESATLAALISRPSGYALRRTPARIRERRDGVLRQMFEAHQLDEATFGAAVATPVNTMLASAAQRATVDPASMTQGPYFVSLVTEQLYHQFGTEKALTGGLRVYTTLDTEVQHFAEEAVMKQLLELDKRRKEGEPLQAALLLLHAEPGRGRVDGIRPSPADHAPRLRQRGRGAGVGRLHEGGDPGEQGGLGDDAHRHQPHQALQGVGRAGDGVLRVERRGLRRPGGDRPRAGAVPAALITGGVAPAMS